MDQYAILLYSGAPDMITTSETAVTITIWILTAAGIFFGTRAALRRKKEKQTKKQNVHQQD